MARRGAEGAEGNSLALIWKTAFSAENKRKKREKMHFFYLQRKTQRGNSLRSFGVTAEALRALGEIRFAHFG